MRRAALYVRVSTDLQEKEQTIQSQLAAVTRVAEQHGLRHAPALTYTDDGYSGTWLDRPGLDELRDHAREGRFEVVVVLCPDRLARRYAYQVLLLEELKRAGVEILFCERPIGDSPDDQLLLQIQGAIAEYERAKILDRCRRGRLHRARRGELAPPSPPYGYTYAARKYGGDGQIRIQAEEAAVVRDIFRWYAEEGASLYGVLKKLRAAAVPTKRASGDWHERAVLEILKREWYVGRAYYNRAANRLQDRALPHAADAHARRVVREERPRSEWIMVPVPRIIDDAIFARAQVRIDENRRFAERRLTRKHVYLLRGLLRCGVCGYAYTGMTRRTAPRGTGFAEHHYYVCTKYSMPIRGNARCTNARLLVAGADEIVWTTVRDLLLDNDAVVEQLRLWLARATADPSSDDRLKQTAARLEELYRQRGRLIDAYQSGALDLDDFRSRKTVVEEGIIAVEHERAELQAWDARRERAARQVVSAEAIVAQLRTRLADADFKTRQAILRLVVEKVVVTGYRLEIHLALPVSGSFNLTSVCGAKR
jgi:site-specific DNA recombinase